MKIISKFRPIKPLATNYIFRIEQTIYLLFFLCIRKCNLLQTLLQLQIRPHLLRAAEVRDRQTAFVMILLNNAYHTENVSYPSRTDYSDESTHLNLAWAYSATYAVLCTCRGVICNGIARGFALKNHGDQA